MGDGSRRSAQAQGQAIITTIAGPATQAQFYNPIGVAIGSDGSIYIADSLNNRIRRVGTDGNITTVAGTGIFGFSGDGGPATQAQFYNPKGVAIGSDGSIYISDSGNNRVRRVGTDGIITTVAGTGIYGGFSGDGGPATQAKLLQPEGVAIGSDGIIYFVDGNGNNRVRRVGTDGIITTVAGTGIFAGFSGDGGPATQAYLSGPRGVAIGSDGSIYIVDDGNRVRRVGPDGIITTVAGTGYLGDGGDGGPPMQAQFHWPQGIATGSDGSFYIADTFNNRIRRVAPALPGISNTDFFIPSDDGSELYIFNSSGRHLRTLDALTGALRYNFTYDSTGKINTITDSDGNMATIERDATGNATAIISPYGQHTNLSLDVNGYLDNVTNPAGESVQLAYTADGLLTSMKNPRGSTYNYSYDALGRLIKDEDPAGGFKALERTDIANGYSVRLSTGLSRNTTYQVEQLSTGDQRRVNIFPDGLKTETIIGTNGSRSENYADGTRTTLVQGPDPRFGMQAPVTKSMTVKTSSGLTASIISGRTAALNNSNDPLSLKTLTENVSINGRTFTSTFDAVSRNITSLTPMGRTSITTLDDKGRAMESQVPGISSVHFTYDARGRLGDIMQGTRTYALRYDTQGNLANVTNPLSLSVGFEHDAAGRVTRQTLPDGRQIQYAYDASGNVISITPPGRSNHAFNYTPVDLIKDYTPPDIGIGATSTNYTYNIDRQLTRVMRPDGAAIDLGYDSAGRLSTINYPKATMSLSYDAATGNLKNITAPDGGKITYAYDGSLLTDTIWSGAISGSVHRTYDNNFRITSESVNGANTVNFQYDLDGLLTQTGLLNLSRDPQNGMLNGSALGNTTDIIGYSSFGEAAGYQAFYNGAGIFSVNYTRDDLGRIVQKNEMIDGATHTYAYMYDPAGRLTNVSKDGVMVSQYAYDANGNRLSYTGAGGTVSGSYDDQDRLLQYGTTTYTYTANGELLSKTNGSQTTTYQYDVMGNLRNVTMPDGTKIEYLVDGLNRRIGKKVNGALMQGFLYRDGLRPVAELDGAGNVVSRFVYAGGNVPDYMIKGGVTYRIVTDHLGSPRLVVDAASGAVMQRMDYDEFGNIVTDTNLGFQSFGFAGGLYDRDTKLVRFGVRDYDAEVGRWTAKDPILFYGGQLDLYGYVLNDPINRRDPSGLEDIADYVAKNADAAVNWGAGALGALSGVLTGAGAATAGTICGGVAGAGWLGWQYGGAWNDYVITPVLGQSLGSAVYDWIETIPPLQYVPQHPEY